MVIWSAHGSAVLVMDDGANRPCARCAWLFDRMFVELACSKRASAAPEPHAGEVRRRVGELLTRSLSPGYLWPAPGHGLVIEQEGLPPRWEAYSPHPSCACAEAAGRCEAPPTLDEAAARHRRFAPVVSLPHGEDEPLARVFFRKNRSPWPTGRREIGAATAHGSNKHQRALAEAIERFCMLHTPPDQEAACASALSQPLLPAGSIRSLLFREEERSIEGFRFPGFDEATLHDWSWIERCGDGRRALVPTTLIGRPGPRAARLADATSNGYAAHRDPEQALLRALLEVVERDAVLVSWYLGLDVQRLELPVTSTLPRGVEVFAFLVTQDIDLPVVHLLALREDGSLRSAAGAGVSFEHALERAMREMLASCATVLQAPRPDDGAAVDDARRMCSPEDHLRYYQEPSRARAALTATLARAATTASALQARWPGHGGGTGAVLDALARAGLDAWFANRSLPHVFGDGWHVVRALVPGAVELSWGQAYRRLASPRVERHLRAGRALSPLPHPIA